MVYIITTGDRRIAVETLTEVRAIAEGAIIDGNTVTVDRVPLSSLVLADSPRVKPRDIVRAWNAAQ